MNYFQKRFTPSQADAVRFEHPGAKSFVDNETGEFRDSWRIFRIMAEFVEGYQFLSSFKNEITILGSARLPATSVYSKEAHALGHLLGKGGYTTITGGGPGIMEAANRGAYESGGESLGLNIQLPFEQRTNPYVKKSTAFSFFITRKVMLTAPSQAFVCFPGGFGTLDEFFEIADYIELGFMMRTPIILLGSAFWKPVLSFLEHGAFKQIHALKPKDLSMCHMVDTAQAAFDIIKTTQDQGKECMLAPSLFQCDVNVNWRIFRIMAELVEGFEFLTGLVEDVTILGTGHIKQGSPYYKKARMLGKKLAQRGFSVVTGGGQGIMEAASRGAFEGGGEPIGINTQVNYKERINEYVKRSIAFNFPFTRKFILLAPSKAFVFFPGGFGTMHELFEVLTLMETGKMEKVPVVLVGKAYWEPLVAFIRGMLCKKFKTINASDSTLFTVVDDIDSVVKFIVRDRARHGRAHKKAMRS